ncbi:hypothetical protein [Rubinisphaera margarita]|uniref:hypothetical protein n=1 Tax=Rubinisphaera margarita TaxID=2909586 RepID=UPI001EE97A00|nr:hypothetical protein [Rubinisphaera margarita]MCG6155889.1 hypothetical protein [Rubinisphaera margarita]
MTSRRRKAREGDGLDLLLDTICNMFGGIVFISLLVVLLLQNSEDVSASREVEIDPREIELLQEDLRLARTELDRLQLARLQQLEFLSRYVPDDLQQRLEDLEDLSEQNFDLENRSQELREKNAETVIAIDETEKSLRTSAELLDELKVDVREMEKELSAAVEEQSVSLPRAQREYARRSLQLSIRFNRVFFRHDPDQLTRGNSVPNLRDYVITEDEDQYYEVQVRPTAGIDLADRARARALLQSQLRRFPSSSWTISLTLWPESFGSFRTLREILTELGYSLTAITPDTPVFDRGGEDRLFQ